MGQELRVIYENVKPNMPDFNAFNLNLKRTRSLAYCHPVRSGYLAYPVLDAGGVGISAEDQYALAGTFKAAKTIHQDATKSVMNWSD